MGKTPPGETRERVWAFVRERILAGVPPTVREVQRYFSFGSVQTAREHIEKLIEEGRLEKEKGRSRGLRLPFADRPPVMVPLIGTVQAGELTTAFEEPEGYIAVQASRSSRSARSSRAAFSGRDSLDDRGSSAGRGASTGRDSSDDRNSSANRRTSTGAAASRRAATGPSGADDPHPLFALTISGESMSGAGILPGDIAVVRRQPTAENGEIVVALVGDEATVKRLSKKRGRIELLPENPAFSPIVPDPDEEFRILGKVIEIRRSFE